MADSNIQLPLDGVGKRLDTRTAPDGDHREVVVVGSPTTADVAELDAANGLDVDVTRSALPTGAATSALQTTLNGLVDGVEALLTTIDADTSALAGTVAGTEVQVDIVALPNEGQQNMAGSISVAIASDQSAIPVSGTVAVTGSATLAEQQTQTGHLSQIEIAVEILDNAISGSEMQVDVVAPLPAGTNNIGDVDVLSSALPTGAATSALQTQPGVDIGDVTVNNAAGAAAVNVQDGGNSLTVDGSVTANAGTNLNTSALALEAGGNLAAAATSLGVLDNIVAGSEAQVDIVAPLPAGTNNIGDVDVLSLPAIPAGTNNIGDVDVLTLPALVAGSANIGDVDIASAPTGSSSISVQGTAANAAAAVGNPVYVGGRASTALPTDVGADGDAAALWLNRNGLQVVSMIPGAGLNADPYTQLSIGAQYTTTQTSAVLLAGGASERIVVTSIQIQVGGTTAGTLQVYFGTGAFARGTNSAIFDGEFAPSTTLKPGYAQAPAGGYRSPTLGHDVLVTTSAAINPLTITIWYYLLGV